MRKSKFVAIAASAALVSLLGLSACGGQSASNSAAPESSGSAAIEETSAIAAVVETSDIAAIAGTSTSASVAAEEMLVSWSGALANGTLVDYISSDDGAHGGLVLTSADGKDAKRWLGAMTSAEDGMLTITDDETKETVDFMFTAISDEGAMEIDVEGYGVGAVVPMSAADWQRVAEAEALAEVLGTTVNTVGMFEDGSLIAYIENQEGTDAVVAVVKADTGELKTWSGKATTAEGGKETVTDETTNETFNYTWTENAEDGTVTIEADGYGKATLVKMTVADWMLIDEIMKAATAA